MAKDSFQFLRSLGYFPRSYGQLSCPLTPEPKLFSQPLVLLFGFSISNRCHSRGLPPLLPFLGAATPKFLADSAVFPVSRGLGANAHFCSSASISYGSAALLPRGSAGPKSLFNSPAHLGAHAFGSYLPNFHSNQFRLDGLWEFRSSFAPLHWGLAVNFFPGRAPFPISPTTLPSQFNLSLSSFLKGSLSFPSQTPLGHAGGCRSALDLSRSLPSNSFLPQLSALAVDTQLGSRPPLRSILPISDFELPLGVSVNFNFLRRLRSSPSLLLPSRLGSDYLRPWLSQWAAIHRSVGTLLPPPFRHFQGTLPNHAISRAIRASVAPLALQSQLGALLAAFFSFGSPHFQNPMQFEVLSSQLLIQFPPPAPQSPIRHFDLLHFHRFGRYSLLFLELLLPRKVWRNW